MSTNFTRIISTLIGLVLIGGLSGPAAAKPLCANPRPCCCCTTDDPDADCGAGACRSIDASGENVSVSGDGSTFVEPLVDATGANGAGLSLSLVYQTSAADGEVGTIKTTMGYGWSHSYNTAVFQQGRDLFRLDPNGIVTKYQSAGRRGGGGLTPTGGNRETVTQNPDGSIDIQGFVGGVIQHFEQIPGNPLRLADRDPWMLTYITDRNGNRTELIYDNGLLTTVTGPYNRQIAFGYDAGKRLTTITDPSGDTISLSYDSAGNLASIRQPENRLSRFSYTSRHQVHERRDANGNRWTYGYDADGDLIEIKDQNGDVVSSFENDEDWDTDPAQCLRTKQRVYEPATTTVTDGNGNDWQYDYDGNGYVTEIRAPDGAETRYTYDPAAYDVASMTDANGNTTTYAYDSLARRIKETDAKGFETAYAYMDGNCLDKITEIIYPNGSKTQYEYDAACNRTKETRDAGGLDLISLWTYNADGTVATETDPNGHVTSYEYDAYANVSKTTDAEANTTRYAYDIEANRTCRVDGNGHITVFEYDNLDRLIRETAKIGTVVAPGDPIEPACTPADADDIITAEYQYDGNGNQTLVRRQSNTGEPREWQVTTYEYDQRDRLVKETQDPGGLNLVTTYSYDGNDNRIATTDPRGFTTAFAYDVQNRMDKFTDALGNITQYGYDPVGNRIEEVDANGHRTCSQYDELNRLTVQIRKMGATSCALTASDDLVTRHFYDSGDPIACGHDPGSPQCAGPMPGGSNLAHMIDPEGKYTYYKYDKVDRRWITIRKVGDTADTCDPFGDPNQQDWCEYTKYDPADNVVARIDANDNRTDMAYYANDWLLSETQDPGGLDLVTSTTYDGAGNVATVTTPRGNVVYNTYDERDQLVKVEDIVNDPNPPYDLVATYAYDGIGNRVEECDGNLNCTGYSYDAVNRLIDIVDPMGETALNDYDPNGNLTKVTDREGHVTCHYYDAINRRTRTAELMGGTNCALLSFQDIWTDTEYDAVGNVTRLITARLNSTPGACKGATPPDDCQITAYEYDEADRLVLETYSDETTREFAYDKSGNLIERVDQLGQVTLYDYNDLYYLMLRDYQDPTEPDDSFDYDIGGRMTVATKDYPAADPRPDWVVTFDAYDAVTRLLQTTQDATGVPMVVDYSYDTPNGIRKLFYPGGRVITETTDLRERLSRVDRGPGPAYPITPLARYQYDLGNRVLFRDYENACTASYIYDANDRLLEVEHDCAGSVIGDFNYDYDKEGNKRFEEKAHDPANSEAYQYDDIYRLIDYKVGNLVGATVPVPITQLQYDLDKVGNWDQFTVDDDGAGPGVPVDYNNTPNVMNEYDEDGPEDGIPDDFKDDKATAVPDGEDWGHDAKGNRIYDGKRSYVYDDENRLIGVTYEAPAGALVSEYRYDALGRRVFKQTDIAAIYGPTTVTRYAYDDARAIEEQDAPGDTLATYVYGNYIDEVLSMQRGGADFYYHQNALWSVAAVTDAAGNVVERYRYTDYGCPTITDGAGGAVAPNPWGTAHSAIGNPYLFTGRRWDEESGLYYYRARYFDGESGRFLQRDVLGYSDGMNLYEYAKSRPTYYLDPTGLICDDLCEKKCLQKKCKIERLIRTPIGWTPDDLWNLTAASALVSEIIKKAGELEGMPPGADKYFGLLGDVLAAAPNIGNFLAQTRGRTLWIRITYEHCDYESCCLFWERLNWQEKKMDIKVAEFLGAHFDSNDYKRAIRSTLKDEVKKFMDKCQSD